MYMCVRLCVWRAHLVKERKETTAYERKCVEQQIKKIASANAIKNIKIYKKLLQLQLKRNCEKKF